MLTVHRVSESSRGIFCLLLTICSAQAAGQTVRGTVHNGTAGKTQSGDLILLMTGAHEIGRAISGKNGDFRIEPQLPSGTSTGTLKVRVSHDGVGYQQPVRFGVAADVTVYDGSARVDGLSEYLSIFQFEARIADRLAVTELHAIQNDSWPPRTSINPETFDLSLPKGAHNLFVTIADAEGQGARLSITDPSNKHGPYKFGVPLKPGLTKYVLTYELPYHGELPFRRSAQYSTKQSFIVLPMSMRFTPLGTLQFHPVPDESGAQVREVDSLAKNDVLAFQVSGTGVLAQAFRPIGGPDESARQTLPTQPAKVEALRSDTSPTSPGSASNQSNQKAAQPAAHSEPISHSVRNWASLAFVLFMLGTLIAWKVSRAKSRHRST
ncbi:MAG TPA: hypothetical protein VN948_10170 [Terriglobales bacterium]|nr:hypothetical protein [Terriglobales bacterium]